MKNTSKSFWNFIKNHKIWSVIILLTVVLIAWSLIKSSSENIKYTEVAVERGSLSEIVSVTGNVKPLSAVDLAFELGGRVASINVAVSDKVNVGQNLASVANADLMASLDQARANLKKALAQYNDVKNGITPQQLALEQTQVDKSTQDLAQAKVSLVSALKNSYTSADDAVRNKMYTLFTDPGKYQASMIFATDNYLQQAIVNGKDIVTDSLNSWYQKLNTLDNGSNLEDYYGNAKTNLLVIKDLLDKCATAVSSLKPGSSISQIQIDTWKSNVSLARTEINAAIDTLTNSYNYYNTSISALKIAQDQLSIGKAGSTDNAILGAQAAYEGAQAGVASAEASLAKSIIKSPIDGVITNIDPKLGEIVPAGKNVISIISYGDYEVEAFVPEADIAKVKIGNLASTTLDAYGSNADFETMVIKIDPAATVIDGVPTYKVTLKFIAQDVRIKSGMTANLDILTNQKNDVLILPNRVINTNNDGKYVTILKTVDKSETQDVKITTGLRGSDGNVEIISGLNLGDKVVTSL